MIVHEHTEQVNRSAEDAFDVIGTHMYDNHPLWEREVVEIRPLTPGPVGVGSRAIMVRQEFGRRSEVEYEITEFEPGRRIAAQHPDDASMDFHIEFDIEPIDTDSCSVRVTVRAQPKGWARLLEPVMRVAMPRRGERITKDLVGVIEGRSARA
jgi:hypothetical protein